MRRSGILLGSLCILVVSAGVQTSCVPEREYDQPNAGDGGGSQTGASDAARDDASATNDNPDAQYGGGGDGGTSAGQISVTLGRSDSGLRDGGDEATNVSTVDAATSESRDATTNPNNDAAATSSVESTSTSSTTTETQVSNVSSVDASANDASTAEPSDAATSTLEDGGPSCSPSAQSESDCSNNDDEDCDGLVDCEDVDDCSADPACQPACIPVTDTELDCSDEVDDDCDGFEDCDDSDCALDAACIVACVPVTEDCTDREDNDCDGFDDCEDSDCATTTECCTAEGVEVCTDGVDNDCDGEIDCPVILETVPASPPEGREGWEGGAVSADMAALTLARPELEGYVVQCRSGKPATVSNAEFVVCDSASPSTLEVEPFADSEGSNADHDGVMTTEVRFAYPNGQVSSPTAFTYYVHSSLYRAETCPDKAADSAFFEFAKSYLVTDDAATFDDSDARLAAPFINIAFTPMASARFEVSEGDGAAEYLSLRRRFVLNADKNMVLMKRVYSSRSSGVDDCRTATIRKHVSNNDDTAYRRATCDAIVLNREGAGVCLRVDDSNEITISNPNSDSWQTFNFEAVNWVQADNFLWRKLLPDGTGTVRVFSAKCYDGGSDCTGGNQNVIYLPDRELFEP